VGIEIDTWQSILVVLQWSQVHLNRLGNYLAVDLNSPATVDPPDIFWLEYWSLTRPTHHIGLEINK
jgi:hypothetical protein